MRACKSCLVKCACLCVECSRPLLRALLIANNPRCLPTSCLLSSRFPAHALDGQTLNAHTPLPPRTHRPQSAPLQPQHGSPPRNDSMAPPSAAFASSMHGTRRDSCSSSGSGSSGSNAGFDRANPLFEGTLRVEVCRPGGDAGQSPHQEGCSEVSMCVPTRYP
jgi:hypothetical protein